MALARAVCFLYHSDSLVISVGPGGLADVFLPHCPLTTVTNQKNPTIADS